MAASGSRSAWARADARPAAHCAARAAELGTDKQQIGPRPRLGRGGAAGRTRPRRSCFAHYGPALEAGLGRLHQPRALVTASPVGGAGGGFPSKPGPPPGGHAERRPGSAVSRAGGASGRWAEPAGRWAGRSRRAEGRSTAAAFSRPVSGAEPRGWPRGGDMLTFRDNSWYQSGNSDVVRHRQRERQREKERAGTGRSSRWQWP